jgi:hypothetical protein
VRAHACLWLPQVASDPLVKGVLQAFQMSLPCCMERSQIPMMRNQLVLRLMAAAQAAAAAAGGGGGPAAAGGAGEAAAAGGAAAALDAAGAAGGGGTTSRSSSELQPEGSGSTNALPGRTPSCDAFLAAALGLEAPPAAAPPAAAAADAVSRMSIASTGSGAASAASMKRLQAEYRAEMLPWYEQQYAACCAASGLLAPQAAQQQQQQQQQVVLPAHLMAYTASLQQAGGRTRMALRGHTGAIRRIVITPAGKDVLTASEDGSVQVRVVGCGVCWSAKAAVGIAAAAEGRTPWLAASVCW